MRRLPALHFLLGRHREGLCPILLHAGINVVLLDRGLHVGGEGFADFVGNFVAVGIHQVSHRSHFVAALDLVSILDFAGDFEGLYFFISLISCTNCSLKSARNQDIYMTVF